MYFVLGGAAFTLVAPFTDFSNELAMTTKSSVTKGHAGLLLASPESRALGLSGYGAFGFRRLTSTFGGGHWGK
jgi:hypothetical protein